MTRWEYRLIDLNIGPERQEPKGAGRTYSIPEACRIVVYILNEAGKDGWEAVGGVDITALADYAPAAINTKQVLLKRPIA